MGDDIRRTTSTIRVRRAEKRDSAVLAGLFVEVHNLHAEAEPAVFKRIDQGIAEERLCETLDSETTVLFLAESDAAVVGYVVVDLVTLDETVFRWASRRVYVRQLGVTEPARGYGAGRVLMAAVDEYAQQTGVDVVTLEHWAFNGPAARFFAKQGFDVLSFQRRKSLAARSSN